MEHAFSRMMAIFTAVTMFFFVPLVINLQRQENLVQLAVMQDTVEFVDSVRNMGVLTEDMYQRYENKIRQLQGGLEVYMVHTTNSLQMGEDSIEKISVIKTENEIVNGLDEEGIYKLQQGDYFRVEVKCKNTGMFQQRINTDTEVSNSTYVYYGGSVRYEE